MNNRSKQREWILECIMSSEGHMNADEVYEALAKTNHPVSVATVYRNLKILEKQGLITSFMADSQKQVFDKTCTDHDHFCCTTCHRLFDIKADLDPATRMGIETNLGCRVQRQSLVLFGTCKECLQKEKR